MNEVSTPGARLRTDVVSPAPAEEWQALVDSDPEAMAFQTPAWTRAVCGSGPFVDASRLYRTPDGRHLVLPMVRRRETRGRLAVRFSMPLGWGTTGLVAEDGALRPEDVAVVRADLERDGLGPVMIAPHPLQDQYWATAGPWAATKPRTLHMVDLVRGFDHVWSHQFRSSVRRAVRKAEGSKVEVERGSSPQLVDAFYGLYQQSVLRWAQQDGVPDVVARWRAGRLEPRVKFERVAERMGAQCVVWLARVEGRPAAAIVVLRQGRSDSYWRGAMDLEVAGPVRANDLLHKLAIADACASGAERYSLGNSEPGSGLARFKEGFGATPVEYSVYVSERVPFFRAADAARSLARRGLTAMAQTR